MTTDTRSNIEKIKSIFYDYAQGIEWLEISKNDLDEIASRIEVEVMGIQDDDHYIKGLVDLTKPTEHKRFTDEWGNSDWRDTGEMGG
jgi:hypothetical protein